MFCISLKSPNQRLIFTPFLDLSNDAVAGEYVFIDLNFALVKELPLHHVFLF